jgi:DNA-binding protein HU-beta
MTKATKKTPAKASAKTAKAPATPGKTTPAVKTDIADKLSKTQLVDLISTSSNLSKKDASAIFDATLEVIVDALKQGKSVGLPGLGTLSVKATAARLGVKPGTSEKIQIPAGKKVAYKVALDLKKSL